MNKTIEAKYFDGHSSASQQIIIAFNDTMNEFRLQVADGISFLWQLEDLQFEQYGSLLELRNANYSGAVLKIDNKDFSQQFYEMMKQDRRLDIHSRLLNLGFSKITAIAFCFFCLMVLGYFYVLPPVAERLVVLLPASFDNEIGDIFMETFLNEHDVDTVKTRYLEKFASNLNLKNAKPLRFTVVKSNELNAFALPNGHIVVYTAILDSMNSSDELVALLGHEVSHVNNRHSTKMLCRNLAGYMVISLIFSDINGVMAVLTDNAQQLQSLSYSRTFEQEADEQGLKIIIDNHVDPNGMVKLFDQLEKENDISIPQIISSHPSTEDRKENLQKIISQTVYEVKPNDNLTSIFESLKN